MATVSFGSGVTSPVSALFSLFDQLLFNSFALSFTSTALTYSDGSREYVVTGTNFSFTQIDGFFYPTGGIIASISEIDAGNTRILITDVGLQMARVFSAVQDELNGVNLAAVENLLTGLDYDYTGTSSADVLPVGARSSDNVLLNLRGDDRFNLLGGNDNVFMGNGNDTGLGGVGNDTVDGGAGNDSLQGQVGNDRLLGGAGNDALSGNAGNDVLLGGSGNDRLRGGDGVDRIYGGTGRDILYGEADADRFIFVSVLDTGNAATRDQLADFDRTEGDTIDLIGLGLQSFRGGLAFNGAGPQARWVQSGANVLVLIDADGDRDVDGSVLVLNITGLTDGDVLF